MTKNDGSEFDSDEFKRKPQIIYTNDKETSILLPPNCDFLTQFWCQIDSITYQGVEYKGEESEKVRVGGGLENWIKAGRNKIK